MCSASYCTVIIMTKVIIWSFCLSLHITNIKLLLSVHFTSTVRSYTANYNLITSGWWKIGMLCLLRSIVSAGSSASFKSHLAHKRATSQCNALVRSPADYTSRSGLGLCRGPVSWTVHIHRVCTTNLNPNHLYLISSKYPTCSYHYYRKITDYSTYTERSRLEISGQYC